MESENKTQALKHYDGIPELRINENVSSDVINNKTTAMKPKEKKIDRVQLQSLS